MHVNFFIKNASFGSANSQVSVTARRTVHETPWPETDRRQSRPTATHCKRSGLIK
ncbi:hypothetical protein ALO52_200020 [Pseudomonas syringae pv. primulae]|uniref:Uncharacterized protein n=1 Tax=Pseudomonas syringae pv. primulae TaxID=251707 RepID=A0A0Q0AR84_9PSED|nr:hypothetical protein ALO52_200020 [Pseudomonas syringae pv. primulae]